MFCKYCGTQISDDAVFCEKCGRSTKEKEDTKLTNDTEGLLSNRKPYIGEICCPNCGSDQLQVISETSVKTSGGGYSGGKGCLGFLLFGPLGLLCGSCGQSQHTTTTNQTFFVCSKCGNKFRSPQELEKEKDTLKGAATFSIVLGIIVLVLFIIAANASNMLRYSSTGFMIFLYSLPSLLIFIGVVAYGMADDKEKEAIQLKSRMEAPNKAGSVFENIKKTKEVETDNKPKADWRCIKCDTVNSLIVSKCVNCGEPYVISVNSVSKTNYSNTWECENCGNTNSSVVTKCTSCGNSKTNKDA